MTHQGTVTVCASATRPDLIAEACRHLIRAGWLVHAPVPFGPASADDVVLLSADHNAKIAASDAVCVVRKPDGTVGESVAAEAAYARQLGIFVFEIGEVPSRQCISGGIDR